MVVLNFEAKSKLVAVAFGSGDERAKASRSGTGGTCISSITFPSSFNTKWKLLQTHPIQTMNSLKNVRVVGSVAAALGVIAALAGSAMSYAPFAFLHGF